MADLSTSEEKVKEKFPDTYQKVYDCLKEGAAKEWTIDKINECIKNKIDRALTTDEINQIKQWISVG